MLKKTVAKSGSSSVVIMDSITKVAPEDKGAIVISASHGGASSGEFALQVPLRLVFFNDAGVGKENAGIAALVMLQAENVAAGTTSHTPAKIGDSADMWDHGLISHLNARAQALGLTVGEKLSVAVLRLLDQSGKVGMA